MVLFFVTLAKEQLCQHDLFYLRSCSQNGPCPGSVSSFIHESKPFTDVRKTRMRLFASLSVSSVMCVSDDGASVIFDLQCKRQW